MRILLSWQLVVAPFLFLSSFAFSESQLSDSVTDPTSSETRVYNPVPIKISSLQHGSDLIKIYDSQTTSNNKKIYFYSPITLLEQFGGVSGNQTEDGQGSLSISFTISSKAVSNKVAQHLTQVLNQTIEQSQVEVIPFDSVRLTSTAQTADFSWTDEWIPKNKLSRVRFFVTCPTQDDCERLKKQIQINPKQFDHLRLEFSPQLSDDADAPSNETNPELLVINNEAILTEGLSALREEMKKYFAAFSQNLERKIQEKLSVALENLEMTRKELNQTKRILEEFSAELNETKREMVKTRDDFSNTADDLTERLFVKETELDEMKITTDNMMEELTGIVERLGTETTSDSTSTKTELDSTKSAITDLTSKLNVAEKKLEATERALDATRIELNSTNLTVNDLAANLNARTREIVDIGGMPTSCGDLQLMGQKISGIFLVKGLTKMEMVYCDFNQKDLQKWIGYADVKSASVHFFVQRSSQFHLTGTPITFDRAWLNEGNAMNVYSGKFTVPKAGTYYFSFTGMASYPASTNNETSWLDVTLYLNGHSIGKAWVHESDVTFHHNNPVTLQMTLYLKKGDQIWLEMPGKSKDAFLHDDERHFTHFTGFMLEEDVLASL